MDETEHELSQAAGLAAQKLENAKYQTRDLKRKIDPLATMLNAPKQLAALQTDLAILEGREQSADAEVATAQGTVTALRGQLADVQATVAAHTESAAQRVLEGAKEGRAVTPAPVDTSECATLEAALTMAKNELEQARAKHAESVSDLTAARRDVDAARAAAAELVFELASRDFTQAAATYRAAGGAFDSDALDMRIRVFEAECEA